MPQARPVFPKPAWWRAGVLMVLACLPAAGQLPVFEKKLQASVTRTYRFGEEVATGSDYCFVSYTRENKVFAYRRDESAPGGWAAPVALPEVVDHPFGAYGGSFGTSLAAQGDLLVVGSPNEGSGNLNGSVSYESGSVYVFQRDLGGQDRWGELAKLLPSNPGFGKHFGATVAISGDTIAASHDGEVHVFERQGDEWLESRILTPSRSDASFVYGEALAIDGDTLVVADSQILTPSSPRGRVYIYERNRGGPGNWGEVTVVQATAGGNNDRFGHSVSVSGDYVFVGCPLDSGQLAGNPGAAYIFKRGGGETPTWSLHAKLTAPTRGISDSFGSSVVVDGRRAVVTATRGAGANGQEGAGYVYDLQSPTLGNWTRIATVVAPDPDSASNLFGFAADLKGSTLILSDHFNVDTYEGQPRDTYGAAYVFDVPLPGPVIQEVSDDVSVAAGFGFELSVTAGGSGPFEYVWEKDGTILNGETSPVLSVDPALPADGGSYRVRVANQGGEVWSEPILVEVRPDPPTIVTPPADRQVFSGETMALRVVADGAIPRHYQWFHDGIAVPDSDLPVWTLDPALASDSGSWTVRIRNDYGVVESEVATVVVIDQAPLFLQSHQPAYLGGAAAVELVAEVTGSRPIAYQWYRDDVPIDGATGSELSTAQAGRYELEAVNAYGATKRLLYTLREEVPLPVFTDRESARRDGSTLGRSVAVDGELVVAGAPGAGAIFEPPGVAYAMRYQGPSPGLTLQAVLRPPSAAAGGLFGHQVGLSGGKAAVRALLPDLANLRGSPVAIFGGSPRWGFEAGAFREFDERAVGNFAISGDLLVFSRGVDGVNTGVRAGYIEVFKRPSPGRPYLHQQTIRPDNGGRGFAEGYRLALDGTVLVAGAPYDGAIGNTNGPGAAYVFETDSLEAPDFHQVATLRQKDAVVSGPFGASNEEFGASVAVDGTTIVVGTGIYETARESRSDSAFVFERRTDGSWQETAVLEPDNPEAASGFSYSLAIGGHYLAVGAHLEDGEMGRVYLYHRNLGGTDAWGRVAVLESSSSQEQQYFGFSVAISGGLLVVGAPRDGIGAVHAFELENPPVIAGAAPVPAPDPEARPVTLDFGPVFSDPDLARGDEPLFSIQGNSNPAIFSAIEIDPLTGVLSASYAPYVSGTSRVNVRYTDGRGLWEERIADFVLPEIGEPELEVSQAFVLNRQTGLYEQTLQVSNTGARAAGGIRLGLGDLPEGLELWLGMGKGAAGDVLAYHHPVEPGETVTFVLEYFSTQRAEAVAPEVSADFVLPLDPEPGAAGELLAVDRMIRTERGSMLIEFASQAGRAYQVQYSSDGTGWLDAGEPVTATANRTQWLDQGPPKTASPPAEDDVRFYRVVEIGTE
ncbi:hypothetical protein [Haloferula sargassicola]